MGRPGPRAPSRKTCRRLWTAGDPAAQDQAAPAQRGSGEGRGVRSRCRGSSEHPTRRGGVNRGDRPARIRTKGRDPVGSRPEVLHMRRALVVVVIGGCCGSGLASDPWAEQVVSYVQGAGAPPAYITPERALGEPARFSPDLQFPGIVSPFNPAYQPQHLVSIGAGGSLVLRFDEAVTNDAANPFGIDLLVFGNAGYVDDNGHAGPLFGADGGTIEVSADGNNWFLAPGLADGPFPTLGYSDA